jgi:choline dehydrogenase-like flavoprotein
VARKNCLDSGFCGEGHLCRYDAKGTSLPWAYIGLNNGLQIIADAEAEKVLIEKVSGGRPVATGVIYKDQNGVRHQVRAARIIVTCGTVGSTLLMFRSGYGPRNVLGSNLIVENPNVGEHLDGDTNSNVPAAIWPEPVRPARGMAGFTLFTTQRRPYGELNFQIRVPGLSRVSGNKYPHQAAISDFAPEFGWKHKEFMRNGGWLRMGRITNRLQTIPWKWRIKPDGHEERISFDAARINVAVKEGFDLTMALYDRMSLKPVEVNRRMRTAKDLVPGHIMSTCRAGESRQVAVCDSDFNCFDIDNLMFASGESVPRSTFCHGAGPIAVIGAFAWRRILANHFSRGNSTKGFA